MAAIRTDGSIIIDTNINTAGFGKGAAGLKSQFQGLGKAAGKLGMVIAAAFSVKAILSFGKEAVALGSDLQEVQNVVDVTFTTMNEQINAFAKNAAATAGLSETMAKRYAGTFGAMAKSFRFSEEEAYDMATALTQLSGDVASFYNISQDMAYTKLKSVFTGETESLKDLGVVMTQTALDDFAMRKGMGKTVSQMTEQEKVALRYQFVLEQLSGAGGDFVRTQDGWANQTRILNLQLEQLKATVGQGLINALTPVLKLINNLIGRLQVLADGFKALTESIFGNAGTGSGTGTAIGDVTENTEALGEATEEAGKKAEKFLAPFDEITKISAGANDSDGEGAATGAAQGAAVAVTAEVTDNITPKLEGMVTRIKDLFLDLSNRITSLFAPAVASWGEAFQSILPAVWSTADQIGLIFGDLWESALVPFGGYVLNDFIPSIVNTFSTDFAPVFASVLPDALHTAASVTGSASGLIAKGLELVQTTLDRVKRVVSVFGDTFAPVFADILPVAMDTFAKNFENKTKIAEEALGWLNEGFAKVERFFTEMCASVSNTWDKYGGELLAEFETFADNAWDTWWRFYDAIIKPVLDKLSQAVDAVWDESLKPLWDKVASFVASVSADILHIYNKVLKPVLDWIIGKIAPRVESLADRIIKAVKDAVKIVSGVIGGILDNIREWFDGLVRFIDGALAGDWKKAWEGLCDMFGAAWDNVVNMAKGAVNAVIWVINQLIAAVYDGISGIVNSLGGVVKDIGALLGKNNWGFSIPSQPPEIPYLARGAVIPPNAPFMAVLGDQRHGTNIEAPLSTIQEAVEAVMESKFADMMNGFAETVAVLREILEAVYGIRIGDEMIAQAAERYNRKLNIARGGPL